MRCFTTHLGIRLRRILRCAASGASGTRPFGIPSFWGGDGRWRPSPYLAGTPCLADTSRRDDRPPTHFFVKKKFSPTSGAGSATQKVSSVFCCAHTLCGTGSITHAGGSFFLYEKSGLRESDPLRGRNPEVCTDLTPPLFRPSKALQKLRVPRGFNPLGESARAELSRPFSASIRRPCGGRDRRRSAAR